MTLAPAGFYHLGNPADHVEPSHFSGKRVHAIAGIGVPERFFHTVRTLGIEATTHVFPDHHDFVASDLVFRDCDAVLMTEKDAVKCVRFLGQAGRFDGSKDSGDATAVLPELYALRVEAKLDAGFLEFLEMRLNGLKTS